ncbi:hypothetical protein OF001_U310001 [Pseudomonas sp. OF001]|nr:hypothetical protein OF001_U310001 [Pseudomonas sp. OF001]
MRASSLSWRQFYPFRLFVQNLRSNGNRALAPHFASSERLTGAYACPIPHLKLSTLACCSVRHGIM